MDLLVKKFTGSSFVQGHFSDKEIIKIEIGLTILLENITKAAIILLCAAWFDIFKITLIIVTTYAILRYFTFGVHALKSLNCTIVSLLQDVFIPLMIRGLYIDYKIMVVAALIFCILIKKFAPADTEKHPLYNTKTRLELNRKATIVAGLIFAFTVINVNHNAAQWILLSELYVVVGISPITYKLLKRRYKNYERKV